MTDKVNKTEKKEVEVVNVPKPTGWVFKGNTKRNGKLYIKGSVCPKNKVEEMDELGFIEEV